MPDSFCKIIVILQMLILVFLCGCGDLATDSKVIIEDLPMKGDNLIGNNAAQIDVEQASVWAQSFFEEPLDRIFEVDSGIINGKEVYIVKVSGLMENGSYPIDTLAICPDTNEQFFFSNDAQEFLPFYTTPQFSSQTSPDGCYRAESVGMYMDGPSGLHELREMRVINLKSGEAVWSDDSFLDNHFLWSPQSQYVAIQYSGRTWTETRILDIKSGTLIDAPSISEISNMNPEFFPPDEAVGQQIIMPQRWQSESKLHYLVSWATSAGINIEGNFDFDLNTSTVTNIQLSEVTPG